MTTQLRTPKTFRLKEDSINKIRSSIDSGMMANQTDAVDRFIDSASFFMNLNHQSKERIYTLLKQDLNLINDGSKEAWETQRRLIDALDI